jgi:NitT/TauT family transport system substrate-binding protein
MTHLTRRRLIGAASTAAVAAPFLAGLSPLRSFAQGAESRKVKFGWSGTGVCLISVPVAVHKGFFEKHDLDVEITEYGPNFDGSLEAVASGQIDATVNFIQRFLKPIEGGVDIRFTGALHGGCIRLIAPTGSEVVDYSTLKGKRVGVVTLASAGKNFLSVELFKAGVNPLTEVEWKVYPVDLLGEAIRKGEIDAAIDADPGIYLVLRASEGGLTEIGGLQSPPYSGLACCAVLVNTAFLEANRETAERLTRALTEAAAWVQDNPDEAAQIFMRHSPADPASSPRSSAATTTSCAPDRAGR